MWLKNHNSNKRTYTTSIPNRKIVIGHLKIYVISLCCKNHVCLGNLKRIRSILKQHQEHENIIELIYACTSHPDERVKKKEKFYKRFTNICVYIIFIFQGFTTTANYVQSIVYLNTNSKGSSTQKSKPILTNPKNWL